MQANKVSKKDIILSIIFGLVVGIINGFFGGGGGMIIIPLLILILKFSTKTAHATAIAIMLPITVVSLIVALVVNGIDIVQSIPIVLGVFVGGIIGSYLLNKLKAQWVTIIFSIIMLAAGVKMLFF